MAKRNAALVVFTMLDGEKFPLRVYSISRCVAAYEGEHAEVELVGGGRVAVRESYVEAKRLIAVAMASPDWEEAP